MARISLRHGLDRDVYQIVKKLEDERQNDYAKKGDGKRKPAKLTVTAIYESIKKSNSSLSRQKRKPLEDAIERVLDFRKEEAAEAEDSDDLLEAAEEAEKAFKQEDRFLLNRQMTKHWNVTPAVTAQGLEGKSTKKRRLSPEPESANGAASDASAIVSTSKSVKTNGTAATETTVTKKAMKPSKYGPEQIPPGSVVLGGVRGIMDELSRYVFARARKPEDFYPFGEQPIGIIISGPPGTGKQSLVRSLSWRTKTPVISLGRYLAETRSPEKVSKIVTDVLDEAKKVAPCIVLIEHLDEYMTKSGNSHSEFDHEVITQLKLNIRRLREWEEGGQRVVVVGTTSKLELIDATLRRPDYFAQTITVKVPDTDAREEIFRAVTKDLEIPPEVDLKTLAVRTHGFVGDDIRAVVQVANRKASDRFMDMEYARARNTLQSDKMETTDNPWDRDAEDVCLWYDYIEHPSYTNPTRVHVSHQDFVDAIAEHTPYMRREGFSSIPSTTWSEVGALHSVRAAFQVSIVRRIKEPLLFQKFGKQRPAGVLLFGPPGCGKTLVAKAVANDAQASFILIKGPELLNKYVGESERAIRELFTRAKSCAPCILFFDEMDSLVPKRENTTTEAGARVVNALLAELDGAGDRGEVYVIGTSNRPDMIDPAVLRPGRLDKLLFVDLPTEDERVDILRTIVRNGLGGTEGDEIESIARDARCAGFSGADLYGLYKNALDECVLRYEGGEPSLTRQDWDIALRKTKPSVPNPETYRKLAAKLHHQT
ncbi:ribosome biogenesis ATPase Rix7 [Colletotrichum truncatum]|uniref:Ribosome biogenesis ATPase Rix7 n=1 Tax=Colletotrichum truncatum TaxID=5467 RepID=A0ACC3Z9K8_COLTU|nr:ribosome biogenesis ATPase Rix7 [Colletotrichum truncatum]KAF6793641.1 ribosome biogenesis ATPase Rix7 [Colletotrichum truncatum]